MQQPYRLGRAIVLAAGLFAFTATSAFAVDVGGFKYDETARVANQDLKLNGAGVRYKAIFSVYSAGLYLPQKKTTPADIYALPGAKRIRLVMQRNVNAEEFGQAFMNGIQQNSDKAEKAKLINQLMKFGQLFASIPELKKGDVVTNDFIPGTGTIVSINGKQVTDPIPDPLFYTVLLRIWLGDKPADAKLKTGLLGDTDEPRPASY
jgi:hypothetical protein